MQQTMQQRLGQRQAGFTFVEMVIVVVIVGILAAVALPRFINLTDEAERASSEGVGGGFASAVGIARAQWEVDNRPDDGEILMSGTEVTVNQFGYPSGGDDADAMTTAACLDAFNTILQSPPAAVEQGFDARQARYYVTVRGGGGSAVTPDGGTVTGLSRCVYTLVSTLTLNDNTGIPAPANPNPDTDGKGFIYNAGTGQVVSFNN
ncbi:prepilin-type N-terminal cleavage/methylation domain-containing protein [Ferrimonas pelagia]|uniref:Prepilin-type N-terminal cleavage/methylation domain-containing protein n=1 Tax=Ferrimonas pelagia TaxID=1177826 RepID=A0ABP9FJC7_9GAMM